MGGRFFPSISGDTRVDHYRCDQCANVWTVPNPLSTDPLRVELKQDRRRYGVYESIPAHARRSQYRPHEFCLRSVVPHQKLTGSEPSDEHFAEVYCKLQKSIARWLLSIR
jgi:hypothetical protein